MVRALDVREEAERDEFIEPREVKAQGDLITS